MDFDSYLGSAGALRQTESARGSVLQPGQLLDGMRVVAFLGRGASCEVWRVHDEGKKCDVALKLFVANGQDTRSPELRERFLSEARLLASIRHPNIIRTYQAGTFRGEPYFAMDLLRPLPLHLRERQIVALGLDLCNALDHLHSISVIHRDVKPDNILIAPDGHYVLADLGIVRIGDASLSLFAQDADMHNPTIANGKDHVLGTPGYAAPEQLAGQHISPATDIHALGVLFDILFEHHPPFLWRLFIRRMTSTIPALRYSEVSRVRWGLLSFKYRWIAHLGFALFLLIGLGGLLSDFRNPVWKPLPPECIESRQATVDGHQNIYWHITLPDNGNYTRGDLIRPPQSWYDIETDKAIHYRSKVVIQGPGRFFASHIVGAEVHLISNVTLVTSSEPTTNSQFRQYFPNPIPVDTNGASMLLPTFTVDSGSMLIRKP